MTVIMILIMVAAFLLADAIVQRSRRSAEAPGLALQPLWEVPSNIKVARNHTWIREESDGSVSLGLDGFLGRLIGNVSEILLPGINDPVNPSLADLRIMDGRRSLQVASPVAGRVVAVNPAVLANPRLLRSDPYGRGWLIKIHPRKDGRDGAFIVPSPADWLRSQLASAKEFFAARGPQGAVAFMQDGGVPIDGILSSFDERVWGEFNASFASLAEATVDQH